ncbi:MAG: hypothetical protein HKO89_07330 [Saprospiraceae bacterium]|nr:hypothetical protein [Bacteroidia bacterium]NNK90405.1 hypothetical protein [Saprospiraceae bacterium]
MSSILIEEPKINISPSLLEELEHQIHEQGQVVVHCILESLFPTYIRIWPTTYLYDQNSPHKSELVHAEKISYFPVWTLTEGGETYFSLIFSGLPKTCLVFDLIEHCSNESGAFKVLSIPRNEQDVYYVQF